MFFASYLIRIVSKQRDIFVDSSCIWLCRESRRRSRLLNAERVGNKWWPSSSLWIMIVDRSSCFAMVARGEKVFFSEFISFHLWWKHSEKIVDRTKVTWRWEGAERRKKNFRTTNLVLRPITSLFDLRFTWFPCAVQVSIHIYVMAVIVRQLFCVQFPATIDHGFLKRGDSFVRAETSDLCSSFFSFLLGTNLSTRFRIQFDSLNSNKVTENSEEIPSMSLRSPHLLIYKRWAGTSRKTFDDVIENRLLLKIGRK